MKNIRLVLFGELVLFIVLFAFVLSNAPISSVLWFFDFTSLILITLTLIPGLIIMGAWVPGRKEFRELFIKDE